MPVDLGSGWLTPELEQTPEAHQPTIEDLRSEQLLLALSNLQDALNTMPAPVIHVAEPDLSAIVQAVTQLKGPASAQEIAQAVREVIDPAPQATVEPVLAKLTEALERLDFRMKGLSGSSGGGGVGSRVQNADGTSLDTQLAALDTRYEWQAQGGKSVPLYVGTAAPGTATSATTWRIDKYTYVAGPAADAVPSTIQSRQGAWDSRASLF